jgi:AcrR family transcriptional regulator
MTQPSVSRDTRRRFAEAAWRLGGARGFKGLTVRALADDLGVSPALLYSHFDDKAALVAELQRFGRPLLVARMVDASQRVDASGPLVAISMAYVDFMREHGWVYEDSEIEALGPAQPHRTAFVDSARPLMGDDRSESVELARCEHLWVGVHGLSMQIVAERTSGRRGMGVDFVRAHVGVLLRGVADVESEA